MTYLDVFITFGLLSVEPIIIKTIPIRVTNIPKPDVKFIFSLKNNTATIGTNMVVPASHKVSTALKSE